MALRSKIAVTASYLMVLAFTAFIGSTAGCGHAIRQADDESKAFASNNGLKIRPLTDVTFERTAARLKRGEYLAEGVLQWFVCHTERDWTKPGAPPVAAKKGAGKVWEGKRWLVASNITPDKETGAGAWTDDMLARAIHEGISHEGRVLDSHMWSASFRGLSEEDLVSVIVYLRSIPPIYNSLPQTQLEKKIDPPTPLTEGVPEPDLSTPLKRGKYLVRIGTCMACHTAFDAPVNPGFFGGGDLVERGEQRAFSANLTSDPSGISYYDEALFIQTLRTGQVKARRLKPLMPWVAVRNMNDEDLKAIFAYLRTRAPVHHAVDNKPLYRTEAMKADTAAANSGK
jgi:mono/diheme cytochrome c family protein